MRVHRGTFHKGPDAIADHRFCVRSGERGKRGRQASQCRHLDAWIATVLQYSINVLFKVQAFPDGDCCFRFVGVTKCFGSQRSQSLQIEGQLLFGGALLSRVTIGDRIITKPPLEGSVIATKLPRTGPEVPRVFQDGSLSLAIGGGVGQDSAKLPLTMGKILQTLEQSFNLNADELQQLTACCDLGITAVGR